MAHRRNRPINLPAPYLKRVWIDPSRVSDPAAYPFCLPFLQREFDLAFDQAITIIVGENGGGKSTLLEGIAAMAGYDEAGGGKGYMPVDHSNAVEAMGGRLSARARAGCRRSPPDGSFAPRASSRWRAISTRRPWKATAGRRTSCRIRTARALRFFDERCWRQGIFIFDEPESALSPPRQIESPMRRMDRSGSARSSWRPTRRSSWPIGSVPAAVV